MNNYSIAEAKNNLSHLVHKVEEGKPVHITRRGKSVAVLLSEDEFLRMNKVRPSPAKALRHFLSDPQFVNIDIDSSVFSNLREKKSGRKIDL
jgi:prevent-host-death family protein